MDAMFAQVNDCISLTSKGKSGRPRTRMLPGTLESAFVRSGLTVGKLAGQLGCSVPTLHSMLDGRTRVGFRIVAKMSEILNVTEAEVVEAFGGTASPRTGSRAVLTEPELRMLALMYLWGQGATLYRVRSFMAGESADKRLALDRLVDMGLVDRLKSKRYPDGVYDLTNAGVSVGRDAALDICHRRGVV